VRVEEVREGPGRWFDYAIALSCVTGIFWAVKLRFAGSADPRDLDVPGAVLFLLPAVMLIWHRRFPVPVLAVTVGGFVLYHGLGYPGPVFAVMPAVVALYTVSSRGGRAEAVTGGLVLVLGKFFGGWWLTRDLEESLLPVAWVSGWVVAVIIWGAAVYHRRKHLQAVEERAAEAERTREELARRRADDERLRIARELHDTLTHAISVVTVQSAVALHLLHRRPELVEPALEAIRDAGQDAMRELRATLGVLRGAGLPGLDQLPDLATRFEGAGLAVRLDLAGDPAEVPPDVGHAVYRMVQEALTNAVRHAAAAKVSAGVTIGSASLDLLVEDDGRCPAKAVEEGHGLRGMRERAEALGGTLAAGPRPGGGFRVRASLPLVGAA
jgi:signal transduction histidine kinase